MNDLAFWRCNMTVDMPCIAFGDMLIDSKALDSLYGIIRTRSMTAIVAALP